MSTSVSLSIVSPSVEGKVKIKISDGGYRISTWVSGAPADHGLLLRVGDGSVFVDITGGYQWFHLPSLLAALSALKAWAVSLPCEAWVVTWEDDGPEYGTIFGDGPDYRPRLGTDYRFTRVARSAQALMNTPVEPIHNLLPVGRHALTQIGNAAPRVRYSSRWGVDEKGKPKEFGDGRFLCPIGHQTFFTSQTTRDLTEATLETQANKRGLDCTTYILMAYQVHRPYQGGKGDDVARCLGCTSYPLSNQPAADVSEFFRQNGAGEFVMWSGGHVVMVVDGIVHEFTTRGIYGYCRTPVADYLGGPGKNNRYSVAVLPGTTANPVEFGIGKPAGGAIGLPRQPVSGPGAGSGANGRTYTVVSGDSLSAIAGKFYGDVLLWPILYDANRAVVGPDPNLIKPGQKLKIPDISGYSSSQLSDARNRGRNWR
jgi:LysM repeat protein